MTIYTQDDMRHYLVWLISYICGDRRKDEYLFDYHYESILRVSTELNMKHKDIEHKCVYRGIIIEASDANEPHNVWKYNHVSFSHDINVAQAFADPESQYGAFIKHMFHHPRGMVLKLEPHLYINKHVWFDYRWAESLGKDMEKMIAIWNQKEIVLGNKLTKSVPLDTGMIKI